MQRITFFERQIIEVGLRTGKSVRAIARSLSRDHRVIQREIDRNTGDYSPYTAIVAQRIHKERQSKKNNHKLEKLENEDLKKYVIEKLNGDWSPEQIAGELKEQAPPGANGKTISYESIYQYIYEGEGRYQDLYSHLRKGRSKRQRRCGRKSKKVAIPGRISIDQRPQKINQKKEYGHWESDTLESGKKCKENMSVQYERKTQLLRLNKIKNKTAKETEKAIRKSLDTLPGHLRRSITFDNGKESVTHIKLREDYNIKTYHCDPYASWQKGGVENINGLLRQYLPKHADFSKLTDEDVYNIQEKLNNRPRKSLNYLTPNQVIAQVINNEGGAIEP